MATAHIGEDRFVPLDQNFSSGYAFSFRGTVAAREILRWSLGVFGASGPPTN